MPADDFIDIGLPTRIKAGPPDGVPLDDGDKYPKVILDQREQHWHRGGKGCETAEDVFWKVWVPFLEQHGRRPVEDHHHREVIPYINWSRWIADCPQCNGAMACWDRNPYACCLSCGTMFKVRWQLPAERAAVIRQIAGRPHQHRNWAAHKGETLEMLQREDELMRGVHPESHDGIVMASDLRPGEVVPLAEHLDRLKIEARRG